MKTRPLLIVAVLLALIVGEAAVCWRLQSELKTEAGHIDEAKTRRFHSDAAARRVAALRDAVAAAEKSERTSEAATARAAASQVKPALIAQQRALTDPKFVQLLTLVDKNWVLGCDGPLFAKLGLSPSDRDRLAELIARRMIDKTDARNTSTVQNLNEPLEMHDATDLTQKEDDDAIRGMIGQDGYDQLRNWEGAALYRSVASQLQQSLSYSDTPLSDQQSAQLVDALVNSRPPGYFLANTGMNSMAPVWVGNPITVTDAELTAAGAVLAPAQHAALEAFAEEQRALIALRSARVK